MQVDRPGTRCKDIQKGVISSRRCLIERAALPCWYDQMEFYLSMGKTASKTKLHRQRAHKARHRADSLLLLTIKLLLLSPKLPHMSYHGPGLPKDNETRAKP